MASEGGHKQAQKRWELENDVTMSVNDETDLVQNHLGGGNQRRSKKGESSSGSKQAKLHQSHPQASTANKEQGQQLQSSDHFWKYDREVQNGVAQQAPWTKDPHYFKHAYISALALLKMTIHTKQGGNIEVMGMLQGK